LPAVNSRDLKESCASPAERGRNRARDPRHSRAARRGHPGRRTLIPVLAVLVIGCGATSRGPAASSTRQAAPTPRPSVADYTTIKIAAAVRDHALFHETDWRRKSYGATLALRTLLTVRVAAGPCATYITDLYGNLRDLLDAYPGEDWRPLLRLVRHQPSLASACHSPQPIRARRAEQMNA
jgi:pimeloyl-ACP methyl ester carboxylesterase